MRTLFYFLIFLLTPAVLSAQDFLKEENLKEMVDLYGGFGMEYNNIDFDELNIALVNEGLPEFNHNSFLVTFEMQLEIYRFFSRSGFSVFNINGEGQTFETSSLTNIFYLNAGYIFMSEKKFNILPYIGYRDGDVTYRYTQYQSVNSISGYLQQPSNDKIINYGKSNWDLGLSFRYGKMFYVMARGGAYIPFSDRWKVQNGTVRVADGPKVDFNYYFGITFGINWISDN